MKLERATKPGRLANGVGRDRGPVVHLVPNPDGKEIHNLSEALCGTYPKHFWSDCAPDNFKVCPKCQKKADKLNNENSGTTTLPMP